MELTEMERLPDDWIGVRDYEEFFRLINRLSEGLEKVDDFIETGAWEAAFSAYREVLYERLQRINVAPLDPRANDTVAAADMLLDNKISLLGTDLVDIGSPIDWFATPGDDKQWQSHLGYLYFPNCLISAYKKTGNGEYLRKWMVILSDFWKNHSLGVEGLKWSHAAPMYRNELAYGCGGEGTYPEYAGGSWLGLSCGRVLLWLSSLAELGNDPAIPDTFLANMLVSIIRDHVTTMLNNPRRYTPNQFFHVALTLTSVGVILPEYQVSPACYLVGIERLETSMTTTALLDGSDMEQSFNYNSGLPGRFYELFRLYEGTPTPRIEKLLRVVHKRCRFLAAVTTPLGTWPAIAKTHATEVIPMLEEWAGLFGLDDVGKAAAGEMGTGEVGAGDGDNPSFATVAPLENVGAGSAAFPYGGYYVFRSGFNREDAYSLFKASRLAIGHMHEDCNSLVIVAYGRRLLIDSGNFNYADDEYSRRFNRYFFSSMSHNTVTVDGLSQGRLVMQRQENLSDLTRPIDTRWYTSPGMSFVEGAYTEGYTKPTSHPPVDQEPRLAGTHIRQVVWIRPDLWIVVDRLNIEGGAHEYTAHWQLGPGYAPELIEAETGAGAAVIRTVDPSGANLSIYSASPGVAFGDVHYASDDPVAGWMATHYNEKDPGVDTSTVWHGAESIAIHLVVARPGTQTLVESWDAARGRFDVVLKDRRTISVTATDGGEYGQLKVCSKRPDGTDEELILDNENDRHVVAGRSNPVQPLTSISANT